MVVDKLMISITNITKSKLKNKNNGVKPSTLTMNHLSNTETINIVEEELTL